MGPSKTMGAVIPVRRNPPTKVVVLASPPFGSNVHAGRSPAAARRVAHGRGGGPSWCWRRYGFAALRVVDEHKAAWVQVELLLEPGLATPQDIGTGLLVGMRRLFLSVIFRRSKNRHSVPMPTATPCSAMPARSSSVPPGWRPASCPEVPGSAPHAPRCAQSGGHLRGGLA